MRLENELYNIKEEYSIKENWKIKALSLLYKGYGNFYQYFSSHELPNNRLILNSFSKETYFNNIGCVRGFPELISNSKIIIIDMANFEEILLTETFKTDSKILILESIIIVQNFRDIIIYDINSLQILPNKDFEEIYGIFYKINDEYIFSIKKNSTNDILTIYKVEGNKLEKYCKLESEIFMKLAFTYDCKNFDFDQYLYLLQDKKMIIFDNYSGTINLLQYNID